MTAARAVVVIGAGPAGVHAALEASRCGCDSTLIDEQPRAGGQVWRAKSPAIVSAPATAEGVRGDRLRAQLASSAVDFRPDSRVWQIEKTDQGWSIHLTRAGRSEAIHSRVLILAVGAQERVVPVEGWTLPGVIGLAAATALCKEHLIAPGKNTVVAGSGPLLFVVAAEILRLGGRVAAVVSQNSRRDWLAAVPRMLTRPDLVCRGARWMLTLRARGVPLYWQHALSKIHGEECVDAVDCVATDRRWAARNAPRVRIAADSVCLGHGLTPSTEAARLAGVAVRYREAHGGWSPEVNADRSTAVDGLFICGDGAGISGVEAALIEGQLAGLGAAQRLQLGVDGGNNAVRKAKLLRQLKRRQRFGRAMTALSMPRDGQLKNITAQTIICRCESLSRGEIEAEYGRGARTTGAIKSAVRAGMGPCGGKFCLDTVARLLADNAGLEVGQVPPPTARPPLRPVAIDAIAGEFDYRDVPMRAAAPL